MDLERYSNPMAALHTVLKRLVSQGQAVSTVGPDGKVRYALKRVRVLAIPAERLDDSEFLDRILSLDLRPHQLARALQGDRPRSR